MLEKQLKVWFSRALKKWNSEKNDRIMPWKGEKDPYKIWLSEIILQQTRVEQGLAYYERFISRYPSVHNLAQAIDNEVFKLWEGLGYYNRCRNLLTTARKISVEYHGEFPKSKEGLLSLKGIGNYTAAAIGSFAFGLPLAVVDGNVFRVLSRVFGISDPIDQQKGKLKFEALANLLLDKKNPAWHNQGMMDLGATICKPKNPVCADCPFSNKCVAFNKGLQTEFPQKAKKSKTKERFLYYLILECKGQRLVRKRGAGDIWKDLHEYILKESDEPQTEKDLRNPSFWAPKTIFSAKQVRESSDELVHQLTHQKIRSRIIYVIIEKKIELDGYRWVSNSEIKKLAFSRLLTRYLENRQ